MGHSPPQELFQKVVPFHCLGSVWTERNKRGKEHLASTVRATVQQFNCVTNCVVTTCLKDPKMKATDRARVVEHWIKVAKVSCGQSGPSLTALWEWPLCFISPREYTLWLKTLHRPWALPGREGPDLTHFPQGCMLTSHLNLRVG